MNAILAIPLPIRLAALFLLGTVVGSFVNLGVYTLAWHWRAISPWSAEPRSTRTWLDRVPLLGWLRLRRESSLHGRGFWVRPLLVEALTGSIFAGLYYWETALPATRWLIPIQAPPAPNLLLADLPLAAHAQFASHVVLVALMLLASLIDVDEQTIPDAITVPGTLVGLALAAICPWSLLVAGNWIVGGVPRVEFLTLASPDAWPAALGAAPRSAGLAFALGAWTLWCFALLPRIWRRRRGLGIAARIFWRRLCRSAFSYVCLALWIIGAAAIFLAARYAPAASWAALLSALVGMAAGACVIWAVRIVGTAALRREAMGFGDVTLMAMIGAYLGWQATLIIFFVAPFAGVVMGVAQWIFKREHAIPYGPFLCLGALVVILDWPDIWQQTSDLFALGWYLAAVLAVCIVLLGFMLYVYRVATASRTQEQATTKS